MSSWVTWSTTTCRTLVHELSHGNGHPAVAGPHPPRAPSKALGKALRVARRDRSTDHIALLQWQATAMAVGGGGADNSDEGFVVTVEYDFKR
jgi:hypothetical protein